MTTPFRQHVEKWAGGCGSELCSRATRVVHYRGAIPCDVLFIGEAPGESEDVVGKPFWGPAGRELDKVVEQALGPHTLCSKCGAWMIQGDDDLHCSKDEHHTMYQGREVKFGMCNLVGCMPRDEQKMKNGQPPAEAIEACAPRLQELVNMAQPRLVVCVGTLPRDWLKPGFLNPVTLPTGCKVIDIPHPAFILRQNIAARGVLFQRCTVAISNAVEDL